MRQTVEFALFSVLKHKKNKNKRENEKLNNFLCIIKKKNCYTEQVKYFIYPYPSR